MPIKIHSQSGKIPEYKTNGACAFDFEAIEDVAIYPREQRIIETGVVIETPKDHVLILFPPNGVGVVDQDYCGPADTIKFSYYNISNDVTYIKKGDRIGQGIFVKILKDVFVEHFPEGADRGGFGSTGI